VVVEEEEEEEEVWGWGGDRGARAGRSGGNVTWPSPVPCTHTGSVEPRSTASGDNPVTLMLP
jgi:hypothetical protein